MHSIAHACYSPRCSRHRYGALKMAGIDLKSSDEFEDPDSTDERTDSTVSPEELELLLRDSDEDHEDGTTDSEPSEDSVQ